MEFIFYVTMNEPYTFDLTQLGYDATEAVPVHDIWANESLGTATGTLTTAVPSHGVRLLRLGDKAETGIREMDGACMKSGKCNDTLYNLSGQPVQTPQKGIYIKNGKKIVVN